MTSELVSVVGEEEDAGPSFANIRELPYLNACIAEIYRYSSIASVAITHSATRDTVFRGFHIRKGTPV